MDMKKIAILLLSGALLLSLTGCGAPEGEDLSSSVASAVSEKSEPEEVPSTPPDEGSSTESADSKAETTSSEAASTPVPVVPQTMDFRCKVVDEEGNPAPNIMVILFSYAPTEVQPDLYDMFTSGQSNQEGLTPLFDDVPVEKMRLEMSNRSISHYAESGREEEIYVPAEDVLASDGIYTIVWHGESYREASEECPVQMVFRVVDGEGNPVPNADITFYCSRNPAFEGTGKEIETDPNELKLTAGGWTDADGRYFYAFPDESSEHGRDGWGYYATATLDGKTAEGELIVDGGYTELTLVLE